MLGNLQGDLFQVVLPRPLDNYLVAIHVCKGNDFLEVLEELDRIDYLEALVFLEIELDVEVLIVTLRDGTRSSRFSRFSRRTRCSRGILLKIKTSCLL